MYTRTHTHSGLKTVLRTLRPSAAKCWGLHGLLVSEPGLERCFPVTASCTPPRRGSGIWPQKCLLGGSGKIWDILRVSSPPAPHQFQYYLFIIYFFILFYFFYLTSHLMFYFFCIGVYLIYNVVLVSDVQQSDSVIRINVSILFQILFPFRLLHNTEQSFLC